MSQTSKSPIWLATPMLLGIGMLGFGLNQSDFWRITLAYLLAFGSYAAILRWGKASDLSLWIGLAVLLRVILVFAFPALSDDIYRFVWDGRLLIQGINPFDHLPAWYLEPGHQVAGLDQNLYQELNSPEYYTIYPPVAQAVFWLSCWLFPTSLYGSSIVMKLFLLTCEVGSIYFIIRLLKQWQLPIQNVLIYALNPLILVEIMGNLHFEGAMVFFLVLALWFLSQSKLAWAAAAVALSIASKLLPLLFMPFLLRRLSFPKGWLLFFGSLALCLLLLFLPLVNGVFLDNFGDSLDLYFRKFEFNASIYYLLRWAGYQWQGYNLISVIGPILAGFVFWIILAKMLFEKAPLEMKGLPTAWLFAICLYLFLATTVHPWYLSLPIVLCLFTPWRFPIIWSALITLTYINYSYGDYWENLWIVAIEYSLVVSYLIWEFVWGHSRSDVRMM